MPKDTATPEPDPAVLTPAQRVSAQRVSAEERLAARMRREVAREQARWKLRRLMMEGGEVRGAPTDQTGQIDKPEARARVPCVWCGRPVHRPPERRPKTAPGPSEPCRVKARIVCGDACATAFTSYRPVPGEGSF